ncbi:MAG: ATP-binding protein [Rhodospirillaceae bacterium]|nr:ATP-binding protein [Rhodospirillaceae bacterium]
MPIKNNNNFWSPGSEQSAGHGYLSHQMEELVNQACLKAICKNAPRGIAANFLVTTIVAVFLWAETADGSIFYWLAASLISSIAGYLNTQTFPPKTAPATEYKRWAMRHLFGAGINGLLWAYIVINFITPETHLQPFIIVVLMGVAVGSAATMASYLPTFTTYVLAFLVPLTIKLILNGGNDNYIMAVLTTVFTVFIISIAKSINGTLCNSFKEKFTSDFLAKTLQESRGALELSRASAEQANIAKSEFLSSMSHELRTPLNAIIGFSDTMKEKVFGPLGNPKYDVYVNDIHTSGQHLLNLINDILDVSAIEAGKISLNEEYADIADIIKSVDIMISQRAANGGVNVTTEIAGGIGQVLLDVRRAKQVLLNIVSNAVKFTPSGGHVSLKCGLDDAGNLKIVVSDNGVGMDEEGIKTALSRFGQIDSPYQNKREGTGLGLPITKELIELHGGSMRVQSALGIGTTVTITIPHARFAQIA